MKDFTIGVLYELVREKRENAPTASEWVHWTNIMTELLREVPEDK